MSRSLSILLILILGLALGAIAMLLLFVASTDIQGMICPQTETAEEDVWEQVEFPEYENPFEETSVNPFEEVYTNPFEKLEE